MMHAAAKPSRSSDYGSRQLQNCEVSEDTRRLGTDRGRRLTIEDVSKRYGNNALSVNRVSFSVEPGEFLTLLGPSGSGKTSVLMMIAGFEKPTEGRIKLDGTDVVSRSPQQRDLGVVFQGYALFPHMSILENVEFPLRMRGVSRQIRERRSIEMLARVGLEEFIRRRPRELSGGQQQRVALARALVFEPNALLLDEPLGALDKNLRETMQSELKELQRRQGVSVVFVTHDQEEAMRMSDRIAVMDKGRIVQIGAPTELYRRPQTPFIANFLGETNLLSCRLKHGQRPYALVAYNGGPDGYASSPDGSDLSVGDNVVVSIRPEQIKLIERQEGEHFVVEGTVTDQLFLGRCTRLIIQAMGVTLNVITSDSRYSDRSVVGLTLRLTWDKDDAQILQPQKTANV